MHDLPVEHLVVGARADLVANVGVQPVCEVLVSAKRLYVN